MPTSCPTAPRSPPVRGARSGSRLFSCGSARSKTGKSNLEDERTLKRVPYGLWTMLEVQEDMAYGQNLKAHLVLKERRLHKQTSIWEPFVLDTGCLRLNFP